LPDHRRLILLSALGLTVLLFLEYFIHDQWELVPDYIPGTPIRITGLFIILSYYLVFILLFRHILKQDPNTNFFYLIVLGSIVVFISEIVFQSFRQVTFENVTPEERIRFFLVGVIGMPILASVVTFSVAFNMKFKNKILGTAITIALFLILRFVAEYFGIIKTQ